MNATEYRIPNRDRKMLANYFHTLGLSPQDSVTYGVKSALVLVGLQFAGEGFILCGRDGRDTFQLEHIESGLLANSSLVLSWHKYELTNRYEVVAYLS